MLGRVLGETLWEDFPKSLWSAISITGSEAFNFHNPALFAMWNGLELEKEVISEGLLLSSGISSLAQSPAAKAA